MQIGRKLRTGSDARRDGCACVGPKRRGCWALWWQPLASCVVSGLAMRPLVAALPAAGAFTARCGPTNYGRTILDNLLAVVDATVAAFTDRSP